MEENLAANSKEEYQNNDLEIDLSIFGFTLGLTLYHPHITLILI